MLCIVKYQWRTDRYIVLHTAVVFLQDGKCHIPFEWIWNPYSKPEYVSMSVYLFAYLSVCLLVIMLTKIAKTSVDNK